MATRTAAMPRQRMLCYFIIKIIVIADCKCWRCDAERIAGDKVERRPQESTDTFKRPTTDDRPTSNERKDFHVQHVGMKMSICSCQRYAFNRALLRAWLVHGRRVCWRLAFAFVLFHENVTRVMATIVSVRNP